MSSIYEQLKAAGVPLDHHESDLYAKVTETSAAILAPHGRATVFHSQVDGDLWYDIPFAYDPWWAEQGLNKPAPLNDR